MERTMTQVFTGDMKSREYGMWLAGLVAERAATKAHRLGRDMVSGTRPLTQAAFDGIMRNLSRCPDKEAMVPQQTGAERYFEERAAASPEYRAALDKARPQARLTFQDIPAGFYATESAAAGEGQLDFWKVSVRKNEFRSVKRVLGGGTAQQPKTVDLPTPQQITALRAIISAGPAAAAALYAEKEERCIKCGRQLTDKTSQDRMMGDWCWDRYGI
jgi:uncharacterized protein DUF6011